MYILRRITAYFIDIMLVVMVASLITSNKYIDINYSKYQKVYDEYKTCYDEYESLLKEFEEGEIDKVERNNLEKEYEEKLENYSYKLSKLSFVPRFMGIVLSLFYFIALQFYFNGQTLGKKIMKLRVVSNDSKNLNIFSFLIRSLIVNEIFISILNLICVLFLSKNVYFTYNKIIYFVTYFIEILIAFTIIFSKDNRGIHDILAHTKVIDERKNKDEVQEL